MKDEDQEGTEFANYDVKKTAEGSETVQPRAALSKVYFRETALLQQFQLTFVIVCSAVYLPY